MNERKLKFPCALTRDVETWRCPNCNDTVDADGPPQCGCSTMKPGYDCCAWCQEHYGPISTFKRDHHGEPICHDCDALRHSNTGIPLYVGFGVFILAVIVFVVIMGMVE